LSLRDPSLYYYLLVDNSFIGKWQASQSAEKMVDTAFVGVSSMSLIIGILVMINR
jgi:hypothetical protein